MINRAVAGQVRPQEADARGRFTNTGESGGPSYSFGSDGVRCAIVSPPNGSPTKSYATHEGLAEDRRDERLVVGVAKPALCRTKSDNRYVVPDDAQRVARLNVPAGQLQG